MSRSFEWFHAQRRGYDAEAVRSPRTNHVRAIAGHKERRNELRETTVNKGGQERLPSKKDQQLRRCALRSGQRHRTLTTARTDVGIDGCGSSLNLVGRLEAVIGSCARMGLKGSQLCRSRASTTLLPACVVALMFRQESGPGGPFQRTC
jgi:hypothetical protein